MDVYKFVDGFLIIFHVWLDLRGNCLDMLYLMTESS